MEKLPMLKKRDAELNVYMDVSEFLNQQIYCHRKEVAARNKVLTYINKKLDKLEAAITKDNQQLAS